MALLYSLWLCVFQSTLPRGSDFNFAVKYYGLANFNPRSLAGATFKAFFPASCFSYFNPRSLAGATENSITKGHGKNISIHAPSRERRARKEIKFTPADISIHAPSRERRKSLSAALASLAFQSTLPRGSDF